MATKKKRGLSGSPEEHKRRAAYWVSMSKNHADESLKSAQKSQCKIALNNLLLSNAELAKAQDNSYDSNVADYGTHEEVDAFLAAEKAFKKNCLVGGGLSGMKRRSRR